MDTIRFSIENNGNACCFVSNQSSVSNSYSAVLSLAKNAILIKSGELKNYPFSCLHLMV